MKYNGVYYITVYHKTFMSATASAGSRPPRRTALLVGINYNNNPDATLNGCYNDVVNVSQYLRTVLSYPASAVNVLTDGNRGAAGAGTASAVPPTRISLATGRWCVIQMAMKPPDSTHAFVRSTITHPHPPEVGSLLTMKSAHFS